MVYRGQTLYNCLKILGPDKIASLKDIRLGGLPLIVRIKDGRRQLKLLDGKRYVCKHMSTKEKVILLKRIANNLNIDIKEKYYKTLIIVL